MMRTTYLRLLQLVSGALIAVLLGIHMVRLHLDAILGFFGVDAAEPRSWESMIERADQGLWVGLYLVLLAFGLYHGLYGLRSIILELTPSAKAERILTRTMIVMGTLFFIGGSYVPLVLLAD